MRVKSKQNTQLANLLHEFANPSNMVPRSSSSIDVNLQISQSPSHISKRKDLVEYSISQDSPLPIEDNNELSTQKTKKNSTLDLISDWLVNSSASLTYEQILAHRASQQQDTQQEYPNRGSFLSSSSTLKPSRNIFSSNLENQLSSFNASSTNQIVSQKKIPKEDMYRKEQQSSIGTLPLIITRQSQESLQQRQENNISNEITANNKRHHKHSSSLPPTLPSLKQPDLPIHQSLEKKLPSNSGKISPISQSASFITNPLSFSQLSRQRLLMSIPSNNIQISDISDVSGNTPKHFNSSNTKQPQQYEESSPLTPNSTLHINNGYSTKGQILKWTESSPSSKALKLSSSVLGKSPTNIESNLPAISGSFTSSLISKPRSGSEQTNLKMINSRNTDISNSQTKPSLFSNVANKTKTYHRNADREESTQSFSSAHSVKEGEIIQSNQRRPSIEDEETLQLQDAWNLLSPNKGSQGNSNCKIKSILKVQTTKKLNVDDSEEQPINRITQSGQKQIFPQSFSKARANSLKRIRQEDNDTPKTTKYRNSQVFKQNSLGDFSEFIGKKKCVNFRETLQIIHIDKNNKEVVEKVHRSD